jgi:hypothetical protein
MSFNTIHTFNMYGVNCRSQAVTILNGHFKRIIQPQL